MYAYIIMSHRTQITLTDEQYERLLARSRRSGLGLAELVRQAVDGMYGDATPGQQLSDLEAGFGAWGDGDHDEDGQAYVQALRPGMAKRLADADR